MFKIGTVTNYLPKTGLAIVTLSSDLFINEKVQFVFEKYTLFQQTIEEIRVDHQKVDFAKVGTVVALRVNDKTKTGTEIFRC